MQDITAPKVVQVQVSKDGNTIWVNVNGICEFRACNIEYLSVDVKGKCYEFGNKGVTPE